MNDDSRQEDPSRIELFEALGHPVRVSIMEALKVSPLGFTDLKRRVGIESSGHLAFHLNRLGGLVRIDDAGSYCLTDDGSEALRLLNSLRAAKWQTYHAPTNIREWWNGNRKVIYGVIVVLAFISLSIFAYNSYSDYQSQRGAQKYAFYSAVATSHSQLTLCLSSIEKNDSATSIQALGAASALMDTLLLHYTSISQDFSDFLYATWSDRTYIAAVLGDIADRIRNGTCTSDDKHFISGCANATWYLENSLFPLGSPSLFEEFRIANLTANIDNFHALYAEGKALRGYG